MGNGEVVIVTGAFGGIGSEIVQGVADDGFKVVACDRVEPPSNWALSASPDVLAMQLDVSRTDAAVDLTDAVRSIGAPLFALVNAHGMQFREPIGTFSDKMFNLVVDVNLGATFRLIRGMLPLIAQPGGRVINFSSLYAALPARDQVAYAAAKAGVEGLTRAAAVELAPRGIAVNAIAPGLVWHRGLEGVWPDELVDDLRRQIPMGRAGTPGEVAGLVAYLLQPMSGYLTGQVLRIDGGASAGRAVLAE